MSVGGFTATLGFGFLTQLPGQAAGLLVDQIHDALPVLDATHLGGPLVGGAFEEQAFEHPGRSALGRDLHAGAGVGDAVVVLGKREKGMAGEVADALGGELIHGDRVAETRLARMGCAGEVAFLRRMTAVHHRMHQARHDREFPAHLLERLQIGRHFIFLPAGLREQIGRVDAERRADREHATDVRTRGAGGGGRHGLQQRQGQGDAGGAQERTTIERGGFDVHGRWKSSLSTTA
jgi:hypothetical protein